MEILSVVLTPIIVAMRWLLELAHGLTGNYGVSIIMLSVIVRLVTVPIAKLASRADERHRATQAAMQPQLAAIKAGSSGRERFERMDVVYQEHGYHPIHAISSIVPLLLQIPFLIAALVLLSHYQPLSGERFLVIADLLKPDALLPVGTTAINLLPLALTLVALIESAVSDVDRGVKLRFLVVAVVIAALIYSAPAGVCLYWMTSNVLSFLRAMAKRRAARA